MPTPESPPANQVPLVVDLDGTLIRTDLLWESLARLLRRNPFSIFQILFWWTRGRACLKQKLAARVRIDPASLPYHEPFLKYLREQKSAGRKIILATASDLAMAKPVADYTGLFDEVLGSDGKSNLRGPNKLKALVAKFGERGFDYAGNSAPDLAVWRGAREAIVVNAGPALMKQAAGCAKLGPIFTEGYSPLFIARSFLNELFIRSRYLAAAGAGLVLAAAFPRPGIAGCAWVAPALMLACAAGKNGGDAFRIGFAAGFSFWLASLYWLLHMPVAGLPILGWVALCAYLALYPAAWTWMAGWLDGWIIGNPHQSTDPLLHQSWFHRLLWSLAGAAAWVALEMIRGWLFGGFPWNYLGASQFRMIPLIQIAAVAGVYGVSFLVVWGSLSLYSAVRMISRRPSTRLVWQAEIALPLTVVLVLFVFSEMQLERGRLARESPASEHAGGPPALLRVTLIQPSVPQTLIWDETESTNRFRQLLELSEHALTRPSATLSHPMGEGLGMRDIDLLVWPESAVPGLNNASYSAITNLIRTHRVWLIFNADDVVPRPNARNEFDNDIFNAAFLFDPDGRWTATYHKQKLVIFGEYIPLVRWLPFVKWFTPITDSFAAGTEPVQFEMERRAPPRLEVQLNTNNAEAVLGAPARVIASPLICYEDMFPELGRRAVREDTDFLVNLTNDGWFGQSAEQWQHMAGSVFRAVENGIPLVRCCNNGVTCLIDTHGRVREIFRDQGNSVYGMGTLMVDLPLQKHAPTFYSAHGDWFGWGCVGIGLLVLVGRFAKQKAK
jgi:apolipoprotein N-acyltransferase